MIVPNVFFYFETDCVVICNSICANLEKQEARYGCKQEKIRRVLQGRSDRDERATSSHGRGDMRKLLDRRR